ncbi:hypothetical protein ABM698_000148 [Salmonella enterica subsp. enterica serovar Newport]
MKRVVYEKWISCEEGPKRVRCVDVVPTYEVNEAASTLRGSTVNFLSVKSVELKLPQQPRPTTKYSGPQFEPLRQHLYGHYRRSSWRACVELLIDDLIVDLEWDRVVAQAGYDQIPFQVRWNKFKEAYHKELCWSPNTRNMMRRLETMPWLQPYLNQKPCHNANVLMSTPDHAPV